MQDRGQILDWLRNSSSDEWNGSMLNKAADEIEGLVSELRAACGYMRNASIDLSTGCKPDPHTVEEVERLMRCIDMAMGCLNPESQNRDERLAWYRLYDAEMGREPRAKLDDELR